jgi:hypothetical protein
MTQGYDFTQIYGTADHSGGLIDGGTYAAVVESSEYGKTKAGDKGQWTIKTRITDPSSPYLGRQLTGNISISPENAKAKGIMFRHLGALGVPVPDPRNPAVVLNGSVPFWVSPQTGQPFPADGTAERLAANMMQGKPVKIRVTVNEWEGGTNNKITNWEANPGGPVTWPQDQQQPQPGFGGFGPPQGAYGQPGFQPAPQGYPTQPAYGQPAAYPPAQYPPAGYPPQGPPQQPYQPPQAPQPWQQAQAPAAPQPPQGPAQAPPWAQQQAQFQGGPGVAPAPYAPGGPVGPADYAAGPASVVGQPPVPGAPAWAQPPTPGAGGGAEFTPQGMSQQPGITPQQPPWAQPQQAQQYQPQGPAPQAQFNGYQPQQQAQQPPAGEAPPQAPWAQ